LKAETFRNFVEYLGNLVADKYYGEVKIKMEEGKITIGEKTDKIKFDNDNYIGYKSRNQ
jgi:hypothetical protein